MRLTLLLIGWLVLMSIRPSMGQNYSLIILTPNPAAPKMTEAETSALMKGHMANITKMAEEGKLLAAGPFNGGGGIFVFKAATESEIHGWLAADPGIVAKRWTLELLPYQPVYGGICPVKAPYEMVEYTWIRFSTRISKSTVQEYPVTLKKHQDYLRELAATGNVVTYANFNERDGGILIMRGKVDISVTDSNPAVQEGLMEATLKTLYIAKGSFCE